MDLVSAAVAVGGPVVTRILRDIWDDWRRGRDARKGMVMDAEGHWEPLPMVSGVLSVADSDFFDLSYEEESPVLITGEFIADESFVEYAHFVLDEEDKRVVMLVEDEETDDVYFYEFGFDGFAISLWPGLYSFYAFIVDPLLDEVLGVGYPDFGSVEDPNPVLIEGEGHLEGDFLIFDIDDLDM